MFYCQPQNSLIHNSGFVNPLNQDYYSSITLINPLLDSRQLYRVNQYIEQLNM
jgi:hypothetical protein